MNAVIRQVLEAVRDGKVTPGTSLVAKHLLDRQERLDALTATRICANAATAHHAAVRRRQERETDQAKRDMHAAAWDWNLNDRSRSGNTGRELE